jgi:hypothetical protein
MDLRDDPATLSSMRGKPISFDDGLQLANELSRDLNQRVLYVTFFIFLNILNSLLILGSFMECSAYTRQGLPEVFQKAVQQATAASQAKRDVAVANNHGSRCVMF